MNRLILVSCVASKLVQAAPARDLYRSLWFVKARRYAEQAGCPWRILSAKYGLVMPDQVIEPYERSLYDLTRAEREAWAQSVYQSLTPDLPAEVTVLAGERYRQPLTAYLVATPGVRVVVPMAGLGIGQQLAWLAQATSSLQQ